jgi:two-component system, chemotaxis family, chemotaxis protein CheY
MSSDDARLKILIVDDSKTSRLALERLLAPYGDCDHGADGEDAIKAFSMAWEQGRPYELICLDIMMPRVDGIQALMIMRRMEREIGILKPNGAKIIMVTSIDNPRIVFEAYYRGGADAYLYKPVEKQKLLDELKRLELIA